jgi:predicted nucleic acid-binding protein
VIAVDTSIWAALRAKVLAKRRKARLADALIAQSCVDLGIPLLTRDRDFRVFADTARLNLLIRSEAD